MIAIAKREFAALFNNVIGWLFTGVVIAFYGLYFFLYNMVYGINSITHTLSAITFIFMITVPLLTMRILSEERHNRTDQLLMTAPVNTWQIVLGKYLALAAVFAIPVVFIAITVPIMTLFGEVDVVSCYLALLGFTLYGLLSLAIGLFISATTESVVISAVITFVLLLLGFMMSSIVDAIFSENVILSKVLGAYDLIGPLDDLSSGTLNLCSIAYYVTVTFLFLFFTVEIIEKRRWTVSTRKISATVFSEATIALVICAVIAANVLMARVPEKYTQIDTTKEKYYSITKKTYDFLKDYDKDVTIYVVGKKADVKESYNEIPKTLNRYKEANKHINVVYVNTNKNPTFLKEHNGEGLEEGSLIVESEERFKQIPISDIYESEFDYETYSQDITGYDGEGQITSALDYVASEDLISVYVLEGHDELTMGDDYYAVMEKLNYDIKTLNLLQNDSVPNDCEALIINGVQSDFSEDDANKIKDYLKKGGNVITTMDFLQIGELTNFKTILSEYGITPVDGVVAEMDKNYYYQNQYYLLPNVESADVTDGLEGTASIFAPFAVGIRHGEEGDNTYTDLMTTSKKAISKGDYGSAEEIAEAAGEETKIKKEEGDEEGPFSIGVLTATKDNGNLVVLGSAYLLSDAADQMVSYRNSRLFDQICQTLIQPEDASKGIAIPVKSYEDVRLTVNSGAANMYGLLFIIVLPLSCLIAGIVIWVKRRRR